MAAVDGVKSVTPHSKGNSKPKEKDHKVDHNRSSKSQEAEIIKDLKQQLKLVLDLHIHTYLFVSILNFKNNLNFLGKLLMSRRK